MKNLFMSDMKSKNGSKGLNIDAEISEQNSAQQETAHFSTHLGTDTQNGLGQQALQIATRILNFIRNAFNPFADL